MEWILTLKIRRFVISSAISTNSSTYKILLLKVGPLRSDTLKCVKSLDRGWGKYGERQEVGGRTISSEAKSCTPH